MVSTLLPAPRRFAWLLFCTVSGTALASSTLGPLPNPTVNPGARNHSVTQQNIDDTICIKGWTKVVRPPMSWTNTLKHKLLKRYGIPASSIHDYELDHLIPLE